MPDFRGLQPLKLKEQVNPKRARIEHSSLEVSFKKSNARQSAMQLVQKVYNNLRLMPLQKLQILVKECLDKVLQILFYYSITRQDPLKCVYYKICDLQF